MPVTIGQWLACASGQLAHFDSARLDADVLMCHVLQCERSHLYARPEQSLSKTQFNQLADLLARREQGEPISYLVQTREFWSLELDVCDAVLVPRPDTELIVELALAALPAHVANPVMDAGTGSGAIAIALAHQWQQDTLNAQQPGPSLNMNACDNSSRALALAQHNASKHRLNFIRFVRSNWLTAFADNTFGMIISNPPYLALNDPHLQEATLQYEPIDALVSGVDGLDAIRVLVQESRRAGLPGCYVLIEHGATQAEAVKTLMHEADYTQVQTYQDVAGHHRVSAGYCPLAKSSGGDPSLYN